MNLKQKYDAYIAGLKKRGVKLTAYPCPDCPGEIETPVPPKGDQYDSLVECPHCGRKHFKVVTDEGRVFCTRTPVARKKCTLADDLRRALAEQKGPTARLTRAAVMALLEASES